VTQPCGCGALVQSYERLADIYRDLLAQQSLDDLLNRAADAVTDLVPCSSLLIAELDAADETLVPILVRGEWTEEIMLMRPRLGEGLIGWAAARGRPVRSNEAHNDPRAGHVAGTPQDEPESIVCVPFVSGGTVLGALSIYREGEAWYFDDDEFAMAERFADAVTLALVNAKAREQLHDLARLDHLTGCLNRRGFHERLDALARAARDEHSEIVLLIADLDDFKSVNDEFGHVTGDVLLQHVSDQLRACAPSGAAVGRLGGDEFALAFVSQSPADAERFAEAIAAAVDGTPLITPAGAVSTTVSVGTARIEPGDDDVWTDALSTADAAMYRRKTSRRAEPRGRRANRDAPRLLADR